MIKTINGDLLNATRGVIIHGCNCFGVMGSGVARGIKNRFPEAFNVYRQTFDTACLTSDRLSLGTITHAKVGPELWIVNAVTQDFYGKRGDNQCYTDYDAIQSCFEKTVAFMETLDPNGNQELPLLFPLIGAGRGGGDWHIIETIIIAATPPWRPTHLYVVDKEPSDCR